MSADLRSSNPLLAPWTAPHGLPPFAQIEAAHFAPAFEVAMQQQRQELDAIAQQAAEPNFDNTVAAFDRSGRLMSDLEGCFANLAASEATPALREAQRELAPRIAAHENAISLHEPLFRRIDAVWQRRAELGLDPEQLRLVERVHLDFVRTGARLAPEARARHAQIMERLATLTTQFGQNVLADESSWQLALPTAAEQAGLPDFVLAAAREAARARQLPQPVITLSRSLIVPFLTFSARRDLREQAWRAWTRRGEHAGPTDNRALVHEILQLRAERAALHGHASFADFTLADTMAGTQAAVARLLDDVWTRAVDTMGRQRAQIDALRAEAGDTGTLEPWDWRYWAEQVRQRHYAIDDAEVKPYFSLERMVAAAFDCAQRLFGLQFTEQPQLQLYHPDVKAYEVRDAAGGVVGLFLHDNFARPTKRSGAWMSAYRRQHRNGAEVHPIIVNNNNFAKAAAGEPTLLGFDDVRTLFHEFGHGLHGLLSSVRYERLAGTQVLRDFVELPSQLYEHWATEPEVLQRHARHVHTGEPIPQALVQRLQAAERFGQGYEAVRYVGSALTDMAVHALPLAQVPADPVAFEAQVLAERGLPHAAGINHRFTHFQHLFAGHGYAAGYYVYLWAEVLDADAWDAFMEAGSPFDAQVAGRLLRHVYAAGNSVAPEEAFVAFRGRPPVVEPMLRQRGLLPEAASQGAA
ncbi:M3 family metallopeptidase [Aquincola sp. J276]|uniref:M3 family metallopeptidase n=1 Tax=Aquincola sp. J276 TaxID=2898432 RepID=UPI002150FF99|nr:M3 family metallopeptidase [Aquincola sp. J276]MCR5868917.1 M3 family metallopeptidase [Aquincola sp. J276]